MKKILLALSLLVMATISAQVSRNPGDFNKLKIYDRMSAELILADQPKVEISGADAKDVIVSNQNGELKIALPPGKLLQGEEISVKIYYQELKSVDASEGAYISSNTPVSAAKLELTAKEGAEIKLEVASELLKVRSVTGAKIRISGQCSEQEISINTGGVVQARELQTEKTDVSINAGGEAQVNASDFVKARTKAGGDIQIYGNPGTIDQKTVLGGSISQSSN